jgi:hypothetical protein
MRKALPASAKHKIYSALLSALHPFLMCLFEGFPFFPDSSRQPATNRRPSNVSRVKEGKHFNRVRWCFTELSLIQFHGAAKGEKGEEEIFVLRSSSLSEVLMARLLKSQSERRG